MPLLLENEFFTISGDADQPIVRSVRNDRGYYPGAPIHEFEAELEHAFGQIDRARYGHLLDIRAVALNNNEEFEAQTSRVRSMLLGGFARVAVLVRTAVGALQSNRLMREPGPRSSAPPRVDVF